METRDTRNIQVSLPSLIVSRLSLTPARVSQWTGKRSRFIQLVQYENATEPHSLGNKASPVQSVSGIRVEIYIVHPFPLSFPLSLFSRAFLVSFCAGSRATWMAVINRIRVGIPSTQRATCCSVPTYTRKKLLQTTLSFSIRPYFNFPAILPHPSPVPLFPSFASFPLQIFFPTQFQFVPVHTTLPPRFLREVRVNRGSKTQGMYLHCLRLKEKNGCWNTG